MHFTKLNIMIREHLVSRKTTGWTELYRATYAGTFYFTPSRQYNKYGLFIVGGGGGC